MKLLIHYHDSIFIESNNDLYTSSNFGLWLNEISSHVSKLGVIAYHSKLKSYNLKTKLKNNNVVFFNLGPKGNYLNYIKKYIKIQNVCKSIGKEWDTLLIRGITPAQNIIWANVNVKKKAYLLVRSPVQERMLDLSIKSYIAYIRNKYNENTLKNIICKADTFMANAPNYLKDFNFKFKAEPKFVPTNIVKISHYPPLLKKPINKKLKLLFVGRPTRIKGIRELFDALFMIKMEKIEFSLTICGVADARENKIALKKSIQSGLDKHINWVGFLNNNKELFKYYSSSDILLLPSYTEGFPRVFWESAINSLPCIITKVGGVTSLLEHKKNAYIIQKKDPYAIKDAILTIIENDDLRQNLIKNAYQLSRRYPLEKCVSMLIKHLKFN